jgi:hypothetical protein
MMAVVIPHVHPVVLDHGLTLLPSAAASLARIAAEAAGESIQRAQEPTP